MVGDFYVCFVEELVIFGWVLGWVGGVDEFMREGLHLLIDCYMIDLDVVFG